MQREIDRDNEMPRKPPLRLEDTRESGERDRNGRAVYDFLAVWPAEEDGGEWGETWERMASLTKMI